MVGGNRAKRLYERLGFERVGPNDPIEKCIAGCVICFFMGCPNRDPCAGFTYSDMVKAL